VEIKELISKKVKIEDYQSTFVVLKVDEQFFRFDFLNKMEFRLKKGTIGELKYFENHPLLIDYNENFIETFINSKPENTIFFIDEIKSAIDEKTLGWRNWRDYFVEKGFFSFENFEKNINDGSGKLLNAPFFITQNVIKVCEKYNVKTISFGSQLKTENYKLILIDNDYIIAKDFKLNNKQH
jgi:hypothetical protein